jgi:hypothetical protein
MDWKRTAGHPVATRRSAAVSNLPSCNTVTGDVLHTSLSEQRRSPITVSKLPFQFGAASPLLELYGVAMANAKPLGPASAIVRSAI